MVWKFYGTVKFPHTEFRAIAFTQNFHTKKLGEISLFYAVLHTMTIWWTHIKIQLFWVHIHCGEEKRIYLILIFVSEETKSLQLMCLASHFLNSQKQPSKGVFRKRCSENMQQIYRRAPMPKCDFNKVAKHIFRTPFSMNISGRLLLNSNIHMHLYLYRFLTFTSNGFYNINFLSDLMVVCSCIN